MILGHISVHATNLRDGISSRRVRRSHPSRMQYSTNREARLFARQLSRFDPVRATWRFHETFHESDYEFSLTRATGLLRENKLPFSLPDKREKTRSRWETRKFDFHSEAPVSSASGKGALTRFPNIIIAGKRL